MVGVSGRARAIDGLLRRARALPWADELILRGGLVTARWIEPAPRPSDDIDFLSLCELKSPQDHAREAHKLLALLEQPIDDGLVYEPNADGVVVIWEETDTPGLRVSAEVTIDGQNAEPLQLDLGYGDPLALEPVPLVWRAVCGEPFEVPAVPPEVLVGWKLHGLFEFEDNKRWRCKDLHDLYLLDQHAALDTAMLAQCIHTAFSSRGDALEKTDRLIYGDFGTSRGSRRQWARYRRDHAARLPPEELLPVIDAVAEFLRPHVEAAKRISLK